MHIELKIRAWISLVFSVWSCIFVLLSSEPVGAFGSVPWEGDGANNKDVQEAGDQIISAICIIRGLTLAFNSGNLDAEDANERLDAARIQLDVAIKNIDSALKVYSEEQKILGDDGISDILDSAWSDFIALSGRQSREGISTLKELYRIMNDALRRRYIAIEKTQFFPIGDTEAWVSNVNNSALLENIGSQTSRIVFSVTVIEMPIARELGVQ